MKTTGHFLSHVGGIPCQIVIDHYYRVAADPRADNPDDFYGYDEIEFSVIDRHGYEAAWLQKKMTADDVSRIESEIADFYNHESTP